MKKQQQQQHSSVKTDRQATQDFYCQNAACSNEFFLWRLDYALL